MERKSDQHDRPKWAACDLFRFILGGCNTGENIFGSPRLQIAKSVLFVGFGNHHSPRRLGSDPPREHWCLHNFERRKIGSPRPVNSDLKAKLQDQMLTEFAGRGAGGEGQKFCGNPRVERVYSFSASVDYKPRKPTGFPSPPAPLPKIRTTVDQRKLCWGSNFRERGAN
jgi:hypothetical protein